MKQNVSPCSLVELILFELFKSKVDGTQEGHHKLTIPGNNSLSGVLQNKILPADF